MRENNSPWLYQLARIRPETPLTENAAADVLIVGGGIAGIATLYFTLKYTNKTVCLLEARRVAHGATGHNAGYVSSGFEKASKDIIAEYGKEMATRGIQEIESAWDLLAEWKNLVGEDLPYEEVTSYGGYADFDLFANDLEDLYLMQENSVLPSNKVLVADDVNWIDRLPSHLAPLCENVSRNSVLDIIETTNKEYCAAMPGKAVITNSALLSDRILLYCQKMYPARVRVHENSPVHAIELEREGGTAFCGDYKVSFKHVVLATNGFENFYIKNTVGDEIDTTFHHRVEGVVGYMSAYLAHEPVSSIARYYHTHDPLARDPFTRHTAPPYFYLTRRNFTSDSYTKLIAIGGPEVTLHDREVYFYEFNVDDSIYETIDSFVEKMPYAAGYKKKFNWHGLMGYTTSGLRLIGPEPENPVLLYNLGCNGLGILTSIYGGRKIADFLTGKKLPPSIFDPKVKE